jgi:hypothetical protein
MIKARHNNGSALTAKANRALRAAGIEGVKVKSSGYLQGGTVSGSVAALILAQPVLEQAGLEVSPLATYSWGTQFYIA